MRTRFRMLHNANGDIVCSSCDVNGQRIYGNVFKDRIQDVYNGPMYQEMREWLLCSRPDPWCPAIKHQCSRRTTPATAGHETTNCRVKVLKLEPATFCNLECPAVPVELQFKQEPLFKSNARAQATTIGHHVQRGCSLPTWNGYFISILENRFSTRRQFRSCGKFVVHVLGFALLQHQRSR